MLVFCFGVNLNCVLICNDKTKTKQNKDGDGQIDEEEFVRMIMQQTMSIPWQDDKASIAIKEISPTRK